MIAAAKQQWPATRLDDRFSDDENLQAAVMKLVQEACEIVMMRNIDRMLEDKNVDPREVYLSVTGGFALNCPTNSMLLTKYGFKGLLTPPSANDSGQALGLGLLGLHGIGHLPNRDFRFDSPYCGNELHDIDAAIDEFADYIGDVDSFSDNQFVHDIVAGPVVWVDGASEVGPRALGHRSILADPRAPRSKDLLNEWKSRQWWRPVAPIVLEEYTAGWFEDADPSPYMLRTTHVREEKREQVPAVLHLDNSARHQTLGRGINPLLHRAIEAFRVATGVPMLCNTSLNEKGEPVVETASEALRFAVRNGAAVAYLGGRRVALRADVQTAGQIAAHRHPRRRDLFAGQESDRDGVWDAWLQAGYTPAAMVLMARSPELRDPESMPPSVVNELAEVAAARDESGTLEQAAQKHVRMFGPSASFDPESKEGAVF
jgi:carbamoyltransferase